ncbi:endo-1,4-beta-xylanase [Cohnella luojiensis]|uniref:Beta-xylanase n=1 Tax=Cohnella luojiensis TaxID=652876 RepID=A0A4Y8M0Y4_9BACL|nr:endo-1,4-beta-xylanase [Cohnella luojiensis]TFE27507.1 1,4-beta-xylanase [Cohnella luojiensis]
MKTNRLKFYIPLGLIAILALTYVIFGISPKKSHTESESAPTQSAGVATQTVAEASTEPAVDLATGKIATGFEDGTVQGWHERGGIETLTAAEEAAHSGTYGLQVTGRKEGWNGPQLDVTPIMEKGKTYTLAAWIKLPAGMPDSSVAMTIQRTTNGKDTYEFVTSDTVTAGEWVKLTAKYELLFEAEKLSVYFESNANPTLDFYVDDFQIARNQEPEKIEVQQDIPALKNIYNDDFKLGTALLVNEIYDPNGPDAQLIKKHFNSLTAGNELKWDATEPREGQFSFSRADQIVDFAMNNGIAFRGHTLIWHSQTPNWVFHDDKGNLVSKEVLFQRMKKHIEAEVGRYKGKVYAWDVVNEVIEPGDKQPGGLRNSPWYQIAGEEFIEKAFEYAHAADPDAKLFINDYNTDMPDKRQYLHDLIKRLKAKGVPIDGIGHQTHIGIMSPSAFQLDQMILAFTDLGIDQQITEMDMSIYTNDSEAFDTFPEDLQLRQAYRYKEIFDVFKKHKDQLSAVIFWGKDDLNTWLRTFPVKRNNWPLLFDERLQAKYAYWALVDPSKMPKENLPVVAATKLETAAKQGTPVIDGERETAWNGTHELATDRWVTGISGSTAHVRTLWDEDHLYVLAVVTDSKLSNKSANAWEQDSVEIFIDSNNAKTTAYESDDGQYRISIDNKQTVNPESMSGNLVSAVKRTDTGYIVEASIAWPGTAPKAGDTIGFDVQVNNDEDGDGLRDSVAIWSDTSGQSYQSTAGLGELKLK